jgi:glutathionylspermidine synthase
MPFEPLASALERLDRRIAGDPDVGPELFARLLAAQRAVGLLHGARPICPYLRPYVLKRSRYASIARAAETLAVAFERVVERALRDDALMTELGLTPAEDRMARLDPGYARLCVTSRFDTFLTATNFQFLEYNAESPAGIADQMLLEDILFALPQVREFLAAHSHWRPAPHKRLLRALLDAYREWGGTRERPRIAIVDWDGVPTESEFRILKAYFESEGYPTVVADPSELRYANGVLLAGDFAIDVLYKRVIIHEFLERCDETHPLARAYADRKVCMANSFRAKIAHKKAGFAILSDPRYEHLFTPEQVAVMRRHVPWTRRVRDGRTTFEDAEHDMIELLRRERRRLVLKPNDDYGGQGVSIGDDASDESWERAIATALDHPYVVQERVPVQRISMLTFTGDRLESQDLLVDFDPFLFNNEVEGGLVRLSSSALSNVSSGGGETALLILEGL